jgi:hypothetical protein
VVNIAALGLPLLMQVHFARLEPLLQKWRLLSPIAILVLQECIVTKDLRNILELEFVELVHTQILDKESLLSVCLAPLANFVFQTLQ